MPETGNLQVLARCEIGTQGRETLVQIRADTAGLAYGTPVRLGITDGAGAGAFLDGAITDVNAEIGITGVEMALPMENPLQKVCCSGSGSPARR